MKKRISMVLAAVLCVALLMGVTACGANEADKAYEDWGTASLPKLEEAMTTLTTKLAQADEAGDLQAKLDAVKEYVAVAQTVVDGLAAIDATKLSEPGKTALPDQLAALKAGLQANKEQIQQLENMIAQSGASVDSGEPDGGDVPVDSEEPEDDDDTE